MTTRDERFEMLRAYLADAGFVALDRKWHTVHHQYRFRCADKHVSSMSGASFMLRVRGRRGPLTCHQCGIKQTLIRNCDIAHQAGGQCLSKRYRGRNTRYRFICAASHKFEATAASVLDGHWCAKCSTERRSERRRHQGGLKPIQDRAQERGGECISTVYDGRMAKYRFRCGSVHEWEAAGYDILRKAWCQECFVNGRRRPDGLVSYKRRRQSTAADVSRPCINVFRLVTHFSATGGTSGWHGVRKS